MEIHGRILLLLGRSQPTDLFDAPSEVAHQGLSERRRVALRQLA